MKNNSLLSLPKIIRTSIYLLTIFSFLSCGINKSKNFFHPDPKKNHVESLLAEVRQHFTGYAAEIHTFVLNNQFILSVWVAVPFIDFESGNNSIIINSRKAIEWITEQIDTLLIKNSGIFDVFDAINPMIVDIDYNIWYRDIIELDIYRRIKKMSQREMPNQFHGEFFYMRNTPVPSSTLLNTNLQKWKETRRKIDSLLNPYRDIKNYAAYPIIFDDYSMIQVYLIAIDEEEMEDNALQKRVNSLVQVFSQASILVDIVQVGILNINGNLPKYCVINRSLLEHYSRNDSRKIHIQPIF